LETCNISKILVQSGSASEIANILIKP
jgi:hypothetical protein